MSEAADGDLSVGGPEHPPDGGLLAEAPLPWTTLHQVHGADVVLVDGSDTTLGQVADAAAITTEDSTVAIRVADCAPVALVADGGPGSVEGLAVAHAGWRGLMAGVMEATVEAVRGSGTLDEVASLVVIVGPHIGSCCYEFGLDDLERLVDRFGPSVASTTSSGQPALDLAAAVDAALAASGVASTVHHDGTCTACDDRYWSFRASGTDQRQAMLAWIEKGWARIDVGSGGN